MTSPDPAAVSPAPSRRSRWLGLGAAATILLLSTAALPFWTSATTVRSESEVTIPARETIDDDLYVFTGSFTLDGSASRDVFVSAGEAIFRGDVGGSVNAAAGEVEVRGPVDGSVRVFAGRLTIADDVGGDVVIAGGEATIEPGVVIDGDTHIFGGSLDMQGTIEGDLSGNVGQLDLDGTVNGSVFVDVDELNLGDEGVIGEDLNYVSSSAIDIPPSAEVVGEVDHSTVAPWGVDESWRGRFLSPLVRTVWLLVTGAVIIAIAPRLVSATNLNLGRPLVAALAGLAAMVLVPIGALLLAITVIGIPASLVLMTVYVFALYLSQFVVGQRVGALLLPRRWSDGSRGYLLLSMTLGVILLSVVRYVPVPFLGTIANVLIAIFGLGAVALLLRQLRPWYVADRITA